ncbi:MAG: hypothetical protein SOX72_05860, partial [Oscillospiraceae bacterium]|nr:hypothetical protein [Oscillospiraceae bacterium]
THGEGNPQNLVLAAMEAAGRIFELSPTEIYTAGEYNRLLTGALGELSLLADEAAEQALEAVRKPKELWGLIRSVDKRHIVSLCYGQLGRLFAGLESPAGRVIPLAAAFPEEFLAACYFYMLYLQEEQS